MKPARHKSKGARNVRLLIGLVLFLPLLFFSCSSGGGSEPGETIKDGISQDRTASVSGRIFVRNMEDGDSFVSGTQITARPLHPEARTRQSASEEAYRTTADNTGAFSLRLPAGTYVMEAANGNAKKALSRIHLAEGEMVTLDFNLTATGDVSGTIIGNEPDILIRIPGTSYMALTDAAGRFTLFDIPVGDHIFQVGYTMSGEEPDYYHSSYDIYGSFSHTVTPGANQIPGFIDLASQTPKILAANIEEDGVYPPSFFTENNWSVHFAFSHEMNQDATEQAISFNPALSGQPEFSWYEGDWYEGEWWYHELLSMGGEALHLPYGQHAVTIAAGPSGAVAASGKAMKDDFVRTFYVDETLLYSYPHDGAESVYVDDVKLVFSTSIAPESLVLTITPEPAGGVEKQWENENSRLRLVGSFAQDTAYTVTVTAMTTAAGHVVTHGLPATVQFTTKAPMLHSTMPDQGAMEVPVTSPVTLNFNAITHRDSVEDGITVTETVGGTATPVTDLRFHWTRQKDPYDDDPYKDHPYGPPHHHYDPDIVDTLAVSFAKEFGKTYTVEMTGATAIDATPIPDASITFDTLQPAIVSLDPGNGETMGLWDHQTLSVMTNTPVNWTAGLFTLVNLDTNAEIPFAAHPDSWWPQGKAANKGTGTRIYIRPNAGLPHSGTFALRWEALPTVHAPAATIPTGNIRFHTPNRQIIDTMPDQGDVNVPLNHRVGIQFYGSFTTEEKSKIENAIGIDARDMTDPEADLRHPPVNFLWDLHGTGEFLVINFTFDPHTNYRISLNDTVQDLVRPEAPLAFTTVSDTMPPETMDLLRRVELDSAYDGSQGHVYDLTLSFNEYVLLDSLLENILQVKEVTPGGEESLSFEIHSHWESDTWYFEGLRFAKEHHIKIEVPYNKTVSIEIADGLRRLGEEPGFCAGNDDHESCRNTFTSNLPYKMEGIIVPLPALQAAVSQDKAAPVISLQAPSDIYFKVAELRTDGNFATDPALEGDWSFHDFDNRLYAMESDVPEYASFGVFRFRPIQYANLKLMLANLNAYTRKISEDPSTGKITETFTPLGLFRNMPYSQIFSVDPDLTEPVLVGASVMGEHRAELRFNVDMSLVTTQNIANYSIMDGDTPLDIVDTVGGIAGSWQTPAFASQTEGEKEWVFGPANLFMEVTYTDLDKDGVADRVLRRGTFMYDIDNGNLTLFPMGMEPTSLSRVFPTATALWIDGTASMNKVDSDASFSGTWYGVIQETGAEPEDVDLKIDIAVTTDGLDAILLTMQPEAAGDDPGIFTGTIAGGTLTFAQKESCSEEQTVTFTLTKADGSLTLAATGKTCESGAPVDYTASGTLMPPEESDSIHLNAGDHVMLRTIQPLLPDTNYTVTVTNLREFGDYYTIRPENSTTSFIGYAGSIVRFEGLRYTQQDEAEIEAVIVEFDIPVTKESLEQSVRLKGNSDAFGYDAYFEGIKVILHEDKRSAAFVYQGENADAWYNVQSIHFGSGIENTYGSAISLDGNTGDRWVSMGSFPAPRLDNYSYTPNSQAVSSPQVSAILYNYNTPMDAPFMTDPANFEIVSRDNPDTVLNIISTIEKDPANANRWIFNLTNWITPEAYYWIRIQNIPVALAFGPVIAMAESPFHYWDTFWAEEYVPIVENTEFAIYNRTFPDGSSQIEVDMEFQQALIDSHGNPSATVLHPDSSTLVSDWNFDKSDPLEWEETLPGQQTVQGIYSARISVGGETKTITTEITDITPLGAMDTATLSPTPAADATVTTKTPTFTWTKLADPRTLWYRVRIYEFSSGTQLYKSDYMEEATTYTLPSDVITANGSYQWRVDAVDAASWPHYHNATQSERFDFTITDP